MTVRFFVRGEVWQARVLTDSAYKKAHGKGSLAETLKDTRQLVFRAKGVTQGIVLHELVHAYFKYVPLGSTSDITAHDHEEIFAEFIEQAGVELIRLGHKLYKELRPYARATRNRN